MLPQSDKHALIDKMILKYGSGFSESPSINNPSSPKSLSDDHGHVVLLTGSTGKLGSEILELLCENSMDVAKIYALNRPSSEQSIFERHAVQLKSKGINPQFLKSPKIVLLQGDTALPNLSLSLNMYHEIRDSVTVVIHNAWPTNLAQNLSFFEPCLIGLHNLIDLTRSSPRSPQPRFLFISSARAAQAWDDEDGAQVPETVIHDARVAIGSGYGESKFVAEHILSRSGLQNATCLRVDQLCGRSSNGAWCVREWVPILVRISVEIGVFPDMNGLIPWIPIDAAAKCTLEVAFTEEVHKVLNLSHPRPVPWNLVMNDILPLPTTSFLDWVSTVRVLKQERGYKNNAIVKLLPGFQSLALKDQTEAATGRKRASHVGGIVMSTQKAEQVSPTLRSLKQLSAEDSRRWMEYWRASNFLAAEWPRAKL